ncbi:hypothetical protein pb186bvf_011939 [Paramecium bursaria]
MNQNDQEVIDGFSIHTNQLIGKGNFGMVYNASHPTITTPLCVKILKGAQVNPQLLQRELQILDVTNKSNNKNIVKIFHQKKVDNEENLVYIFMEKCDGRDLKDEFELRQRNNDWFTLQQAINLMAQIIQGYQTLFDNKIIHRDLKPANLLLFKDMTVKITDFGMGRILEDVGKKLPLTKVGTPAYAAPQLYLEQTFSSKADVYSLGIIFYQLVNNGNLPFNIQTVNKLVEYLKNLKHNPQIVEVKQQGPQSQELKRVIESMLKYNEEDRISWQELFNLEIFKNGNPKQAQNVGLQLTQKIDIQPQLQDSMFVGANGPIKFDHKAFQLSSGLPNQKFTREQRLHHYVQILTAKSELAYKLIQILQYSVGLYVKNLSQPNQILIFTCLVGYCSKLLQNVYGFSYNMLQYIASDVRKKYDSQQLQEAIATYEKDAGYDEFRKQIIDQNDILLEQFKELENRLIQSDACNSYPKDIKNFTKLLEKTNLTDYSIYHAWFKFFYSQDLQKYLQYQKNQQYDQGYLKLLAFAELFLNIEKDYPLEQYYNFKPCDISPPLDMNQEQLRKIIEQKRNII